MKVIAGTWHLKPEQKDNFMQLSAWIAGYSAKEEGYISYRFLKDEFNENQFLFFEEWKDQAAIDYHIAQWYFKEFMEKAQRMLLKNPVIRIYDVSSWADL